MRNILFISILTILASACSGDFFDQTITIEPPEYDKQMVLHMFASQQDSLVFSRLTRNYGILEDIPLGAWDILDASMAIYENGQLILNLTDSPDDPNAVYKAYTTPGLFKAGQSYQVKVTHPDYPELTATQVLPNDYQVDSVRYRENAGISPDGSELSAIDAYIVDKAGEKNFYEIEVQTLSPYLEPKYDTLSNGQIIWVGYDTLGYSLYPIYPDAPEDPNVQYGAGQTFLVSDQIFDGSKYRFSLRFYRYDSSSQFYVKLRSVTEDYYRYKIQAQKKFDSEESPLSDPVFSFNNLNGGIGIFSLFWEKRYTL